VLGLNEDRGCSFRPVFPQLPKPDASDRRGKAALGLFLGPEIESGIPVAEQGIAGVFGFADRNYAAVLAKQVNTADCEAAGFRKGGDKDDTVGLAPESFLKSLGIEREVSPEGTVAAEEDAEPAAF
jgi:hypothetical protein